MQQIAEMQGKAHNSQVEYRKLEKRCQSYAKNYEEMRNDRDRFRIASDRSDMELARWRQNEDVLKNAEAVNMLNSLSSINLQLKRDKQYMEQVV